MYKIGKYVLIIYMFNLPVMLLEGWLGQYLTTHPFKNKGANWK
jgi:hypothetical protein